MTLKNVEKPSDLASFASATEKQWEGKYNDWCPLLSLCLCSIQTPKNISLTCIIPLAIIDKPLFPEYPLRELPEVGFLVFVCLFVFVLFCFVFLQSHRHLDRDFISVNLLGTQCTHDPKCEMASIQFITHYLSGLQITSLQKNGFLWRQHHRESHTSSVIVYILHSELKPRTKSL